MPIIATKSAKVYLSKCRRRGRVFCDSCGRVVRDDYYWAWLVVNIGKDADWKEQHQNSCINMACSGGVLLGMFANFPYWTEEPAELFPIEIIEQGKLC